MKKLIVLRKPVFPVPEDQMDMIRQARREFDEVIVLASLPPDNSAEVPRFNLGDAIKRQIENAFARKILICGISGSGKTYLAKLLAPAIGAIHLNNDAIRGGPHAEYGWSEDARTEHAYRVGQWADILVEAGHDVVIDMICPTPKTREALKPDFTIYMATEIQSQYADTDALFVAPAQPDYTITSKSGEIWTRMLREKLLRHVEVVIYEDIDDIDLITP